MMRRTSAPELVIVIPCFNEEKVLPITVPKFKNKLDRLSSEGKISSKSRILFVNDGSHDRTWDIIKDLSKESPIFTGISLSRNRGHQNALLAGLMEVKNSCDITISIDCDGQDDIDAMDEMIDAYLNGAEIVYGIRRKRQKDGFLKRTTAQGFYKLLDFLGAETVYNHADYRLVSSRVLQEFADFTEVNIYLRGLFPMVGFNSTSVYYERQERAAGQSHYSFSKMITLAIDGITSLSVKPIHFITGVGILISIVSFLLIIYALISYFSGNTVPGWTSSIIGVSFLGGIQLASLGIIGEYIGKIYLETKRRPRYIISDRTEENNHSDHK